MKLELYKDVNNVGQGTHVMVLPCSSYLKKYHNKIGYVQRNSDNTYTLSDMGIIGNSKKERLSKAGHYCPIFYTNAIEGIHFEWIDDGIIYDRFGKDINV